MTYDLHFCTIGNQKNHIQFCKDGGETGRKEERGLNVFFYAVLYCLKLFQSTWYFYNKKKS